MPKPLQLLTIIGARPQIIKAAAIGRAVAGPFAGRIEETLLHTGQHYDAEMSQVFFDEMGISRPHVDLGVGSGSHGTQTARMIEGIEREILERRPDVVLLYGDTNSTLAGAIAASKLIVPIAHVEAGLRSFNKEMPEEVNRITSDHCSTWLFCPTRTAVHNLEREGFRVDQEGKPTMDRPWVMNVGDVMFDNSLHFAAIAKERSVIVKDLGLSPNEFILVTVHRNKNTDEPERLNAIMNGLIEINRRYGLPIVIPMHPRTRDRAEILEDGRVLEELKRSKGIYVIPPAGFLDMIALESNARLIITDSGGVQKEAHFFGKPSVVLRSETEWVELVDHGQATLVDADPERLARAVAHHLGSDLPTMEPIFGDGQASDRICEALLS